MFRSAGGQEISALFSTIPAAISNIYSWKCCICNLGYICYNILYIIVSVNKGRHAWQRVFPSRQKKLAPFRFRLAEKAALCNLLLPSQIKPTSLGFNLNYRITTHLRLKKQKSLENPSLSGAQQFWRSRNMARRWKGRREYLPYCQGLWRSMGAFLPAKTVFPLVNRYYRRLSNTPKGAMPWPLR